MHVIRSYESLSGAVDASFQQSITSQDALDLLKAGALRAQENRRLTRDAAQLREDASLGQAPYAAVLSCIDSRVPVEQIFDAVSGDLFVARVAGNVAASSVVASLEFATALAGAKAILVLGHSHPPKRAIAGKRMTLMSVFAITKSGDSWPTKLAPLPPWPRPRPPRPPPR